MADLRHLAPAAVHMVARRPTSLLVKTYFDLSVTGLEHLPKDDAAVIASNHFSHLDPPLIAASMPRFPRFLAVDDLYGRSRAFDAMMGFFEAIPLDRDGYPVHALRVAVEHALADHVVGLFPEGRRVERWGTDDPKRGAAWLAWMTGAPLIPVTIHGTADSLSPTERRLRRTAVRIWFDAPLWWYDYTDAVDPLGAMMEDWYGVVDAHLRPWRDDHA